jgi:hypothetical protein
MDLNSSESHENNAMGDEEIALEGNEVKVKT